MYDDAFKESAQTNDIPDARAKAVKMRSIFNLSFSGMSFTVLHNVLDLTCFTGNKLLYSVILLIAKQTQPFKW